jgi:putative polyketide hydroxylase
VGAPLTLFSNEVQSRSFKRTLLDTYEEERRNTAFSTMQTTNRIAREVFDINSSASKNDWEKVRALIAQSRLRGAGLGQDLGITYARGALLPDGSAAPVVDDPINDYEPSARPGSRAPHLRIERQGVKLPRLMLSVGNSFCWPDQIMTQ